MKLRVYLFFIFLYSVQTVSQEILISDEGVVEVCSGIFYDPGGTQNHGPDEDYTITICPEEAGQTIQIDFTSFSTQPNADILTIYNGNSDQADEFGIFSGFNISDGPGFISADNPSGCLTFHWISNSSAHSTGWEATVSCFEPCQEIIGVIENTNPLPDEEGKILVCPGEEVEFFGSGEFSISDESATYSWDFGDGNSGQGQNVSHVFQESGIFSVGLTISDDNPEGCSSIQVGQIVLVAPSVDFSGTQAASQEICFGESTIISGAAETTQLEDCAPEIFEQTWLQDTQTTGQQASYESTISVECYADGLDFTDVSQLIQICVVIEHSYIGDLDMLLTAPNGQSVYFAQYGDGNDPGTSLGIPDEADNGNPGTGFEYCFTPTSSVDISLTGGSNVPAGIYGASNGSSFTDLLGTSLNGDWTFTVIDSWAADDGTLFSWNLDFDPALSAPPSQIVSQEWVDDPSITSFNGNDITVTPTQAGEHCFEYFVIDDFGCEYSQTVCINVSDEIIVESIIEYENNGSIEIVEGDDLGFCGDDLPITIYSQYESDTALYSWYLDGQQITGSEHFLIIDNPLNGLYSVDVEDFNCVVSDQINLDFGDPSLATFELTPTCDGATATVTGLAGGTFTFAEEPTDGAVIDTVSGTISGGSYETTYTVIYTTDEACPSSELVELTTLAEDDSSFELTPTCDGATATVTGLAGGTFTFAEEPTDGAVIDTVSGTISGGSYETTYTVIYTTDEACPSSELVELTTLAEDDSSFELTPTCDGATATVTGLAGGTFTFAEEPTDGAVIDTVSGTISGGSYETTYTVIYTTDEACPSSELVELTTLAEDDSSFELTPTCDGATATVTGLAGGTFTFAEEPTDGAVIDTVSGTISGGSYETTYTVIYTTDEACPSSELVELTTLAEDDSSFELTPTCDGATATVTGLAGGTFTFAEEPTDGAVIDTVSGTISGGSYETTYTVIYTTDEACPSSELVELTTLAEDDSSFELTPTCDGATATVTGLAGGTFTFAEEPTDGAVIDTVSGTISGGSYGSVYNITYTTNIICESSSLQTVSPIADNSSFELTPTCDGATATITGLAGGTFTFAEEPTDGAVIDSGSGLVTGGDFGSEYQISYTTNGICPTSTTLFINVNNPPTINEPTALDVCDDNIADGIVEMDLTIKNAEITNGNPNYSVSYFISEEDALSNSNPLSNLYTNISNPQTIYVSVTDIITNCFTTTSLELNVISPPIVESPPSLEFCDADADGFGVFDLTQLNDFISDGQNGLAISYHETASDAENNIFPIVGEYNNIVAYEQTIYIRVESESVVTDCATYLSTQILVSDKPQIDFDPLPFEICDDEIEDGFTIIDLSQTNELFLNGLDPSDFTITYYETQENAENTENAIVSPFAYTNISAFNQVIWIHVENTETGCFNITSLELIINDLPQLTQPTPMNLCDDNNPGDEVEEFTLEDSIEQVLQGQTGIEVTFYTTQENADSATNPISSPYTNTSNPQTIYIRGEYEDTGCHSTITLDLRVNPIPSPLAAEPIEECDEDNDGFTFFTIDANEVEIINGELNVFLSYYETIDNAENAVDPIFSPYYNILSGGQTIFIRAENALTGCFTIIEQELITKPSPELPVIIEDIEVCDDDYDEITVFDLTQRDEDIYGDQSTTDFTLSYHESLLDAETGDDPIVSTSSYQNLSNPQTIYVRLEGFDNSCVSIGEFNLLVSLPPVIQQPTPLEECDDEVADQITEFDLTSKNDEITAGNTLWDVVYYETEQDALDNTNAIENPEAYANTSVGGNPFNPQTLFVAITNELGCIAYTTLTIKVLPNPTPNTDPVDLELCDYDNPGDQVEVFDITLNEAYIIDGEPGVSITYYESLDNAITETDVIVDPTNYINTTPGQQTIYARVTNDATGCYTMVDFDVIVNVVPNIAAVGDIISCEVNTDNFYEFDLDSVTGELLGSQDPANFTVTYYEDLVDAENGINAITSPYTNLTNPQELFVNITSDITGCFIIGGAFNIEVQEAAIANGDGVPAEISICEDDPSSNDGIMEFDLTELDTQILDGQDPVNFTVTYYETLEDADNGVNALATTYENISNPQVIFARVDNDTTIDSQCYAISEATLEVNLLPEFTLEDLYIACVDVNGSELVESSLMEIDLSPSEHTFEWFDPTDTLVATTQSYTPLMSGTYTAVATSLKGCKYYVTTEVSGSSPAIVEALVTTLAFAEEHVIEANAVGTGDYEYSLDDGPWQLDGTFTDVSAGIHTVTVRDLNGCGIGIKTVLVIDYPRFFTPNGDGYNDTWHIVGIDTRPLSKIYIFDRYGKLLKELSPTGEGWDGTYNGLPLPATDYWFRVEYEEPGTEIIKTFRAHFSLKR